MSIFVPPYINKEIAITRDVEIQSGILRPQGESLNNVDLRATLEKAVDDAGLNVTERKALNDAFYHGENRFNLFKKGEREAVINTFYRKGRMPDKFTREVQQIKIPEDVSIVKHRYMKSSKGDFKANLDNALKKLKQVLKGNI